MLMLEKVGNPVLATRCTEAGSAADSGGDQCGIGLTQGDGTDFRQLCRHALLAHRSQGGNAGVDDVLATLGETGRDEW